jgi:hypothetical protein
MKRKKINPWFIVALILAIGGLGYGAYSLTTYLIKKNAPHPKTKTVLMSPREYSIPPAALEKITKKADSTLSYILDKVIPGGGVGGLIMLFFQIKKSKREEEHEKKMEELEEALEEAKERKPRRTGKTQYPKK